MSSQRHGAIFATWAITILVLVMVVSVGLYTRTTLRSVEQTLPTTLLAQLEDLSRITEGVSGLAASADVIRRDPSPGGIDSLLEDIETVFEELITLRNTYVFDNLVQALAFHAVVAPALVDARQWLTHGLSGHPPDSALALNIVHSRLHEAQLKASAVRYDSHETAQAILVEQRQRLERFLTGVNLLLLLVLVISAMILGLMLRQHKLLRSEARAQAERERLSAIVESTNDLVSTATLDGRLTYLNTAGQNLAGWENDGRLDGKQVQDLHPEWALELIQGAGIPAALRSGAWVGETAVLNASGAVIPVMQTIMAHMDANGRPEYLSTIMRDISERKQAEQEQAKLQGQLLQAQKMESLGILAGGVAHDFNNLLQVMSGNIELLMRDKPKDHPDEVRLKAVTLAMDRAAQLVEQLLFFSRKSGARRTQVDLNREVENVGRMLERTIPKMIALELHLGPSVSPFFADPVQIEQILLNLVGNAVDAMPEGGRLTIETSIAELDEDFVRVHAGSTSGRHVLLIVSDTGCGMEKETLAHIFDPFFTTKEVGKGTGLGLTSVYGIVKAHGGYIQCYSEPGQGTIFRVYLPAVELGDMATMKPQPEAPLQGGSETILVVDDDLEIQELTREVLDSLGYAVKSAATGEEALEIFTDNGRNIDLVLLDLNMPGMGGYKCLEALLRIDPQVKVVIASGYTARGNGRDMLFSGARGFIGKPYRLQELAAMLRNVLDEREIKSSQGE